MDDGDTNGDGVDDEPGLQGFEIVLDRDANGIAADTTFTDQKLETTDSKTSRQAAIWWSCGRARVGSADHLFFLGFAGRQRRRPDGRQLR